MSRYVSDIDHTLQHRVIAERIIGRKLPKGAVVHHIDGNGLNNETSNLLICPSQAYHKYIHYREDALRESGHAHWLRCVICKKFDDPEILMKWKLKVTKSYAMRAAHYECSRSELSARRKRGYVFKKKK